MESDTFVPIVKPVGGRCDLDCSYCYFKRKADEKHVSLELMKGDTLKSLIGLTCSNQASVEFIWHGGEPLLAGIDFFEKVVEYESGWVEQGREVRNSIQTNGTLIDEQWLSFLVENRFTVGVSLDGPPFLHNQTRRYPNRKGSFGSVMKGIQLLNEANNLSDVICCVSSANCRYPLEIFSFLVSQGIRKIKFLQVQGRNKYGRLLPNSVNGEQYASFLLAIFKEWVKLDNPEIEIREIKSIINLMLGGDFRECMFAGECHKYFTVYPDGSIYGCDSLPKVESLRFGCVTNSLMEIKTSQSFVRFCQREEELKIKCQSCSWFPLCRGGCLQDWYPDIFNAQTRNLFCKGMRKIFTEFEKALKEYQLI